MAIDREKILVVLNISVTPCLCGESSRLMVAGFARIQISLNSTRIRLNFCEFSYKNDITAIRLNSYQEKTYRFQNDSRVLFRRILLTESSD